MDIKELDKKYIADTYARFDVVITGGQGSIAFDEQGKEYIDLGGGIAVNTFGYCDKVWQQAVAKQMGLVGHTSNLYYTAPQTKLAEMLCEKTGMKKVFFGNSGAEANECAIKTARKYAADKYGASRNKIITLKNSFHGRTIATLAATGQDAFHNDFGPFPQGFEYAEANDINDIIAKISDDTAAVMIELIQGEGGLNVLDKKYVTGLAAAVREKDVLLIVDEVQTGNGRTGSLYAYQQYGIAPDVVTTAKGLGGGLPIGAVMFGEKTENVLGKGQHGSTFGGNPICAAGAVSILERLDDELFASVKHKESIVREALSNADGVKGVCGMGLMLGIEVEGSAAKIAADCVKRGLLVLTAKDKIRLLPALNIPDELLMRGVDILKGVIKNAASA